MKAPPHSASAPIALKPVLVPVSQEEGFSSIMALSRHSAFPVAAWYLVLLVGSQWWHDWTPSFPVSLILVAPDQIGSVTQSCPTLCDPMNRGTPGLPVHHQLLEFTETHVHQVSDAIQPSHPLLSPSPPVRNPSQHQSLFQWAGDQAQPTTRWAPRLDQEERISHLLSVSAESFSTCGWFSHF